MKLAFGEEIGQLKSKSNSAESNSERRETSLLLDKFLFDFLFVVKQISCRSKEKKTKSDSNRTKIDENERKQCIEKHQATLHSILFSYRFRLTEQRWRSLKRNNLYKTRLSKKSFGPSKLVSMFSPRESNKRDYRNWRNAQRKTRLCCSFPSVENRNRTWNKSIPRENFRWDNNSEDCRKNLGSHRTSSIRESDTRKGENDSAEILSRWSTRRRFCSFRNASTDKNQKMTIFQGKIDEIFTLFGLTFVEMLLGVGRTFCFSFSIVEFLKTNFRRFFVFRRSNALRFRRPESVVFVVFLRQQRLVFSRRQIFERIRPSKYLFVSQRANSLWKTRFHSNFVESINVSRCSFSRHSFRKIT